MTKPGMTNIGKYSVLLLLLAALFGSSPALAASGAAGSVDYLAGKVSAIRDGKAVALQAKAPVYASDSIVTGDRGRVKLIMNDGSRVYIGRNSRISLEKYSSRQGSLLSGTFNLLWGKARFIVEKLREENASFSVKTTTAVLGVRGTNFIVSVGMPAGINPLQAATPTLPPLPTRTLLTEGRLHLHAVASGRESMMEAGHMAVISPAGEIDIRPYSRGDLDGMGANVSEMLGSVDDTTPDVDALSTSGATVPVVVQPPTVIWGTQQVGRGATQGTTTIQVPITVQPPVIVEKPIQ